MKFGAFDHIDANGMGLADQYLQRLSLVGLYEELGFYCYHLAEHHCTPLGIASSPSVFLSAVAQRTTTIKFGPLVYLLPLHHPVRLLEEIGMLDQMSGGRLQLGVGRGGAPVEHMRFGLKPEDLTPMFDEVLEILFNGLEGDVVDHDGKFYQLHDVPLKVRPLQKPYPPIWYGTNTPERAVWAADKNVNLLSNRSNAQARPVAERFADAWAATGKPIADKPFIGVARNVYVAETDAEAIEIASRAWKAFTASFHWLSDRTGFSGFRMPEDFSEAVSAGILFAGSPASVRDWVKASEDEALIDYMAVELVFGDMTTEEATRGIELFGREVIPAFDPAMNARSAAAEAAML